MVVLNVSNGISIELTNSISGRVTDYIARTPQTCLMEMVIGIAKGLLYLHSTSVR